MIPPGPSVSRASRTQFIHPWMVAIIIFATVAADPASAQSAPPQNLSAWGMFAAADWVVKTVMIGLALASVATWTVLVAKTLELKKYVATHQAAYVAINDAHGLADAEQIVSAEAASAVALLRAARMEIQQSEEALDDVEGLKERVASRLGRIEAASARLMQRGTSILATIGAVAPFVGLFGTVWGIMNSFIGIAASQTTNLAVVAPGIAEALLATALGLVAAIPAVVVYNYFTRRIAGYRAIIADISAAILRLVSRDGSRGMVAATPIAITTVQAE